MLTIAAMSDIISTIIAVLLLVFLGQILWRRQFVPNSFWDGLSKICYWILFPCLLFDLVSTLTLDAPFLFPFPFLVFLFLNSPNLEVVAATLQPIHFNGRGAPRWAWASALSRRNSI